jgi:hypothetical protein
MRTLALRLVVIAAAVAVIVVLPSRLSDYHQLVGGEIAIFFIAILGLDLLTGYTGQISLGHGAFMAIGGYTTAILYRDHAHALPWHSTLSTIPAAAAASFAFGVLVGIPALRLSGAYLALATFSFRHWRIRTRTSPADATGSSCRSGPATGRTSSAGAWPAGRSCSPGSSCVAVPAGGGGRSATATRPRPRPASTSRSTRRSRSGSRRRSPGWPARCSC